MNLKGVNLKKERTKNSDGADGSRYTVGSQTVFPGEITTICFWEF